MTDEQLAKIAYTAWCGHDPDKENWLLYSFLNDYDGEAVRDGYVEIARAVRNAVIDDLVSEAEAMNPKEDFTILDSDAWQVMAWLRSHKTDD